MRNVAQCLVALFTQILCKLSIYANRKVCYNVITFIILKEVCYMAVRKSQQQCVNKYIGTHYDRINLTVPKGI